MSDDPNQNYDDIEAADVVEDAIEFFETDADEPAATEIPEDMPPPPNA